jgi:DNA-binding MarR family transcriptional regulator
MSSDGGRAATSGRDLMDSLIDSWRRELPGLDRPEFDMVKRVVRLEHLLEEALARCVAPWNLTRAEYYVLSILRTAGDPYELRPTDLRGQLLLTSGGIANIIKRLERIGLVERVPNPVDGRSSWVRLTRRGLGVADETIQAWATIQEQMFGRLDGRIARQASDVLRDVLLAVGDGAPAAPAAQPRGLPRPPRAAVPIRRQPVTTHGL